MLALLTLPLIFWRFVEWIASLLRLSDTGNWQNSQKNTPVWDRSDYAHFFRNLFRVERVTELEILAPSARASNENEILMSTKAAQEGRSNYLKTAIRNKSFSDASQLRIAHLSHGVTARAVRKTPGGVLVGLSMRKTPWGCSDWVE